MVPLSRFFGVPLILVCVLEVARGIRFSDDDLADLDYQPDGTYTGDTMPAEEHFKPGWQEARRKKERMMQDLKASSQVKDDDPLPGGEPPKASITQEAAHVLDSRSSVSAAGSSSGSAGGQVASAAAGTANASAAQTSAAASGGTADRAAKDVGSAGANAAADSKALSKAGIQGQPQQKAERSAVGDLAKEAEKRNALVAATDGKAAGGSSAPARTEPVKLKTDIRAEMKAAAANTLRNGLLDNTAKDATTMARMATAFGAKPPLHDPSDQIETDIHTLEDKLHNMFSLARHKPGSGSAMQLAKAAGGATLAAEKKEGPQLLLQEGAADGASKLGQPDAHTTLAQRAEEAWKIVAAEQAEEGAAAGDAVVVPSKKDSLLGETEEDGVQHDVDAAHAEQEEEAEVHDEAKDEAQRKAQQQEALVRDSSGGSEQVVASRARPARTKKKKETAGGAGAQIAKKKRRAAVSQKRKLSADDKGTKSIKAGGREIQLAAKKAAAKRRSGKDERAVGQKTDAAATIQEKAATAKVATSQKDKDDSSALDAGSDELLTQYVLDHVSENLNNRVHMTKAELVAETSSGDASAVQHKEQQQRQLSMQQMQQKQLKQLKQQKQQKQQRKHQRKHMRQKREQKAKGSKKNKGQAGRQRKQGQNAEAGEKAEAAQIAAEIARLEAEDKQTEQRLQKQDQTAKQKEEEEEAKQLEERRKKQEQSAEAGEQAEAGKIAAEIAHLEIEDKRKQGRQQQRQTAKGNSKKNSKDEEARQKQEQKSAEAAGEKAEAAQIAVEIAHLEAQDQARAATGREKDETGRIAAEIERMEAEDKAEGEQLRKVETKTVADAHAAAAKKTSPFEQHERSQVSGSSPAAAVKKQSASTVEDKVAAAAKTTSASTKRTEPASAAAPSQKQVSKTSGDRRLAAKKTAGTLKKAAISKQHGESSGVEKKQAAKAAAAAVTSSAKTEEQHKTAVFSKALKEEHQSSGAKQTVLAADVTSSSKTETDRKMAASREGAADEAVVVHLTKEVDASLTQLEKKKKALAAKAQALKQEQNEIKLAEDGIQKVRQKVQEKLSRLDEKVQAISAAEAKADKLEERLDNMDAESKVALSHLREDFKEKLKTKVRSQLMAQLKDDAREELSSMVLHPAHSLREGSEGGQEELHPSSLREGPSEGQHEPDVSLSESTSADASEVDAAAQDSAAAEDGGGQEGALSEQLLISDSSSAAMDPGVMQPSQVSSVDSVLDQGTGSLDASFSDSAALASAFQELQGQTQSYVQPEVGAFQGQGTMSNLMSQPSEQQENGGVGLGDNMEQLGANSVPVVPGSQLDQMQEQPPLKKKCDPFESTVLTTRDLQRLQENPQPWKGGIEALRQEMVTSMNFLRSTVPSQDEVERLKQDVATSLQQLRVDEDGKIVPKDSVTDLQTDVQLLKKTQGQMKGLLREMKDHVTFDDKEVLRLSEQLKKIAPSSSASAGMTAQRGNAIVADSVETGYGSVRQSTGAGGTG
eukprot:TRINITY_DN34312_c0_g1_i2.p1 TRINITY_DN34312_c0_g1~~TRINITY_DN34312_c0_g1_i2.p1  ORF type:complete len:1494 (-),score=615.82 TRINITY_DN34312_c0_g1_i2:93-4574(-)